MWKNVKTLIIPAIIISIIGYIGTDINRGHCAFSQHASGMMRWLFTESGPWFIISLFWVKMIYWCLFRLSLKAQTWIVVILYLCGLLLHTYDVGDNIQWHRHALMMMPYMFLGRLLKDHMELLDRYINRLALAAAILLPAQFLLYLHCNYSIPMHDRGIYVSFQNFPIHFCNVILGTSATFWLARKLQDSNWLKIFGAGSLLIYLINEPQQRFILKFMMPLYDPNMCTGLCYLWNTVTYLLCVAVFLVVVKVVYSNKYLSYLVGKW